MKKEGLHVYILSNYGDWTYQRTKDNALDFLPLTDGDIFSYSVRQVKPDVEIYETLLKNISSQRMSVYLSMTGWKISREPKKPESTESVLRRLSR